MWGCRNLCTHTHRVYGVSEVAGLVESSNFWLKNCHTDFQKDYTKINSNKGPALLTAASSTLIIFYLVNNGCSSRCEARSPSAFNWQLLVMNYMKQFSRVAVGDSHIFSWEISIQVLCSFLIGLFVFQLNATRIKIPMSFFTEIENKTKQKTIFQFVWEHKRPQIDKQSWENKGGVLLGRWLIG